MRTGRILHPQLARALAELGHTDIAMVVDAGFPIPRTVERIDLGFSPGIPSLAQILGILRQELFVEKVTFAEDVPARNPRLFDLLREIYTGSGADFATVTHEQLCTEVAPRAKLIIRSGSLEPWGNVALTASTDPFAWFSEEAVAAGMQVLPEYIERRRRITEGRTPQLP